MGVENRGNQVSRVHVSRVHGANTRGHVCTRRALSRSRQNVFIARDATRVGATIKRLINTTRRVNG